MVVGGWGAAARQDPDEGDGAGASDRVRDPVMWRCPRATCNFRYNNRFVSACVECNEPRPAIADPRTAARRQGPEAQIVIRDDPVPAPPGAKGFEAVVISDSEEEPEAASASVRRDDKQGGETAEVFGGWISDDAPEEADEEEESQDLFEPVPQTKRARTEENGGKQEGGSAPERKRQRAEGGVKIEVDDAGIALSSSRPALSPPNTQTSLSLANARAADAGPSAQASNRGSSFRMPCPQDATDTTDTFPKILASPVARTELPRPRLAHGGLMSFEGELADRGMYVERYFRDKAQQKGCARAVANDLRTLVQVLYVDAYIRVCVCVCVCVCVRAYTRTNTREHVYVYTCVKRDLLIWQKRPTYMAKETYLYGKRGLQIA